MSESHGDLQAFGRNLAATVNPMWLLRTLPNNVLGHIGIKYGLKGTNACIDFTCGCGAFGHVDASFTYALRCSQCGNTYQMGTQVVAKKVEGWVGVVVEVAPALVPTKVP